MTTERYLAIKTNISINQYAIDNSFAHLTVVIQSSKANTVITS